MKINVILKENIRDDFTITEENTYYLDSVFTNPELSKIQEKIVRHNIFDYIEKHKINPKNTLAGDFANIALAVYSIDQITNREQHGLHSWSRYFNLYIPVYNTRQWNLVKKDFEDTLSFLSGDKWILNFRSTNEKFPELQSTAFRPKRVCLFSGGMDSFIGVNDLIDKYDQIATISHHKGGNSGELSLQKKLIKILNEKYKPKNIHPFYFYVQGVKNENLQGEKTQRARSIIFLALGLLIANTAGEKINIVIPENGLISLNLPLTPSRGGSHSTKTTHPKYINGLNDIFHKIGIGNRIENPYRFLTKGEMLTKCKNTEFVKGHIQKTLSCSKPGYHKQYTKSKNGSNKNISLQCGYCVPCIIRRASLYKNDLDNYKHYVSDVNSAYTDYRAFELALLRFKTKQKIMLEFLKAGNMELTGAEIKNYINMYYRGIKEVKNFVNRTKDQ